MKYGTVEIFPEGSFDWGAPRRTEGWGLNSLRSCTQELGKHQVSNVSNIMVVTLLPLMFPSGSLQGPCPYSSATLARLCREKLL